jgi:hypothetical protein
MLLEEAMESSRHKAALSTACLAVVALMVTVPFKTEIFTDVSQAIRVARW